MLGFLFWVLFLIFPLLWQFILFYFFHSLRRYFGVCHFALYGIYASWLGPLNNFAAVISHLPPFMILISHFLFSSVPLYPLLFLFHNAALIVLPSGLSLLCICIYI
ncbi:hypothetical protein I7I53_10341 [Histoplasma capsulatum var. duboisii H88]|uniref:Uncharacterized protein n=1 Tax=Ajellomyces capsulatus (strain H88) TaxID=544711 RepID=A0A8A1LAL6_AJEC8|nr:hypothetical protein I7I53_10341 [Histoplasma capsulatum var. duboisii H88]